MIRTLIVDDEPLARARLRRMLDFDDVQIVGEAENSINAIKMTKELRPDVLFLDIRMPGISGLQMSAAMRQLAQPPLVVFVTGYSEHALTAFEHEALDYLLKPITAERLAVTHGRVRDRLSRRTTTAQRAIRPPVAGDQPLRNLPVRTDYAVRFIPVRDILCSVARDKRVFVRTNEGEFRTYYTLTQLESLLPQDNFLRIHDSSLVNLDAVTELCFLGDHTYEIRLSNNQMLRVGRTRYAELQRRMGLARRAIA